VTFFAYGDSVHNFTKGQRATGITNAESGFQALIGEGLKVQLCGTCLAFRGIRNELIMLRVYRLLNGYFLSSIL
jgi:sulfur relay (sulfurtransferase) complex TusBCD TusD component (DsrE family)